MNKITREEVMHFFRELGDDDSLLDFLSIDDCKEIALECAAHNDELYDAVWASWDNYQRSDHER